MLLSNSNLLISYTQVTYQRPTYLYIIYIVLSLYAKYNNSRYNIPTTSIIRIFLSIPTTTACRCKRSFSCLKRLKTYLKTTMGQE